eukprot:UN25923
MSKRRAEQTDERIAKKRKLSIDNELPFVTSVEKGVKLPPEDLANKLSEMYHGAKKGEKIAMIVLFGVIFSNQIKKCDISPAQITKMANISRGYGTEINKGMKLSKYLFPKTDTSKKPDNVQPINKKPAEKVQPLNDPTCIKYKELFDLLNYLKLSKYYEKFEAEEIDLKILIVIVEENSEDLRQLLPRMGPRTKVKSYINDCYINKIKNSTHSEPSPAKIIEPKQRALQNIYVVEDLVDRQVQKGEIHFLVKWEGYPSSANTWEPESNFNRL